MFRTHPLIVVFEQHSFSSGSQVVEKLIKEQWCQIVGFELPYKWKINDFNQFYNEKMQSSGFINEKLAEVEFANIVKNKNQMNLEKLLTNRKYFSAKARLKLLQSINENDVAAIGLDISMEEREALLKFNSFRNVAEQCTSTLELRNFRILKSITESANKSMVCILGIHHASGIISLLKSKGIFFIPCFILDSWVPKKILDIIDSTYPRKKRNEDDILEFTSVDAAIDKLHELLLPYSIRGYQRLDKPTVLTNELIHKTKLPFFSICSDRYQVAAVTKISNIQDEEKAKDLYKKIGYGNFFSSNNKRYFGLTCINMPECSDLPTKISQLK